MGTNYYFYTGEDKDCCCPTCGHSHKAAEVYHIGKSSYGWYFHLHEAKVESGAMLSSLEDWIAFIKDHPKGKIKDEYGQETSLDELIKIVKREGIAYDHSNSSFMEGRSIGDILDEPGYVGYGYKTVIGMKGLLYLTIDRLGEDGLYTIDNGEFC